MAPSELISATDFLGRQGGQLRRGPDEVEDFDKAVAHLCKIAREQQGRKGDLDVRCELARLLDKTAAEARRECRDECYQRKKNKPALAEIRGKENACVPRSEDVSAEKQLKASEERAERLQKKVQELEKRQEEMIEASIAHDTEVKQAKQMVETLQRERDAACEAAARQQQEISDSTASWTASARAAESEKEEAKREAEELRRKLEESSARMAVLDAELEACKASSSSSQQVVESERQKADARHKQLGDEVERLQRAMLSAEAAKEAQVDAYKQLEKEGQDARRRIEELTAEVEDLRRKEQQALASRLSVVTAFKRDSITNMPPEAVQGKDSLMRHAEASEELLAEGEALREVRHLVAQAAASNPAATATSAPGSANAARSGEPLPEAFPREATQDLVALLAPKTSAAGAADRSSAPVRQGPSASSTSTQELVTLLSRSGIQSTGTQPLQQPQQTVHRHASPPLGSSLRCAAGVVDAAQAAQEHTQDLVTMLNRASVMSAAVPAASNAKPASTTDMAGLGPQDSPAPPQSSPPCLADSSRSIAPTSDALVGVPQVQPRSRNPTPSQRLTARKQVPAAACNGEPYALGSAQNEGQPLRRVTAGAVCSSGPPAGFQATSGGVHAADVSGPVRQSVGGVLGWLGRITGTQ
eukprot:TRINITY_DN5485_c0_g1_i2.p1 TRINITY_DN5485_c0_g1~~TRINITY_DN5485_c0_g1_i2.p1  ORF type:complete len:647 (-),score=174.91 TRINITY_DN5485_c0_g1_i2:434-2374(-)